MYAGMETGQEVDSLYAQYRRQIEETDLPRALQRAAFVLFAVNTAFIAVDVVVYPTKAPEFLPVRLAMNAIVGLVFFGTARRFPIASSFLTVGAGCWMLLTVVQGTGGASSDYYVGLVLLVIGIGVLAPLSVKHGSFLVSSVFAGYLLLGFFGSEDWATKRYALSLFFLGAASFCGVMSCWHLERMRFADFLQRIEIEKARDELAELDVAKSRFTANIHHELRTPLTLTLAPVEAMLSGEFGEIPAEQRSYLETVQSNGLRLLKLINNLLDLAKIESQQLTIERRPVRIGELVNRIVNGARPLAERKGVALRVEGFEDVGEINVDSEAFEKILVNLLGNALKFTDRGGRIVVRGETAMDGGVHLVVSDTGVGIPADQLGRIFDRFAQVDGSNTRKHEGTGIGLSLVKELAELHEGSIWAESDGEGQGAQMHLVLPEGVCDAQDADAIEEMLGDEGDGLRPALKGAIAGIGAELEGMEPEAEYGERLSLADIERNVTRAQSDSEPTEAPEATAHPDGTGEVLIVEDNADMRRLLADLVSREYRVRVARNGREGLDLALVQAPDLILTDVMMPEMSGTELCKAVKEHPDLGDVPVVLVTSKAEREMKIEGLEFGADDYVTKPFHPRELMARVRSLVRLRLARRELAVRNDQLESTNAELILAMAELKQAGAQLVHAERLAAVGELAAGVAHEINNPVNFAMNAARTLRCVVDDVREVAKHVAAIDGENADELKRQIQALGDLRDRLGFDESAATLEELSGIVTEGLERTAELVGDLRDFAAPGGHERGEMDLARGLRTTLRLVGHTLVSRSIEVHTDLPEGLPRTIGDARALNQVFLNLLKNAAESFEGRGGSIWVAARAEGNGVAVSIRDDGPGMSPEVRQRLFEPFFTTKGDTGTGLGLSICKRIVEEHGGRLEIESASGEGTTASLHLPHDGGGAPSHAA